MSPKWGNICKPSTWSRNYSGRFVLFFSAVVTFLYPYSYCAIIDPYVRIMTPHKSNRVLLARRMYRTSFLFRSEGGIRPQTEKKTKMFLNQGPPPLRVWSFCNFDLILTDLTPLIHIKCSEIHFLFTLFLAPAMGNAKTTEENPPPAEEKGHLTKNLLQLLMLANAS